MVLVTYRAHPKSHSGNKPGKKKAKRTLPKSFVVLFKHPKRRKEQKEGGGVWEGPPSQIQPRVCLLPAIPLRHLEEAGMTQSFSQSSSLSSGLAGLAVAQQKRKFPSGRATRQWMASWMLATAISVAHPQQHCMVVTKTTAAQRKQEVEKKKKKKQRPVQ
uniref:Uncharacterized protein n=1 Tax=Ditylenchus dipsaci TaxID=166011 RepID=A0A915CZV8_9BILA